MKYSEMKYDHYYFMSGEVRGVPHTFIKKQGGHHICPTTNYYCNIDYNRFPEETDNLQIREATHEEMEWLNDCIIAGHFVSKPTVEDNYEIF